MITAHDDGQTANASSAFRARLSRNVADDDILPGRTTAAGRTAAGNGPASQTSHAAKTAAAPATLLEVLLVGLHDDMIALQSFVQNVVRGIDESFTRGNRRLDQATTPTKSDDLNRNSTRAAGHGDP